MDAFIAHRRRRPRCGAAMSDTDQIIPAEYLQSGSPGPASRTACSRPGGRTPSLRAQPPGVCRRSVLRPAPTSAPAPRGSTRVALMDYGFRVVISSRFADIFRREQRQRAVCSAVCAQDDVELLWKVLENEPGAQVSVDLVARTASAGDIVAPFHVDD